MNVCVFLHIRFLMESLAAKVAGVGTGVAVDQKMGRQGATSLERFSTLWALKLKQVQLIFLTRERGEVNSARQPQRTRQGGQVQPTCAQYNPLHAL